MFNLMVNGDKTPKGSKIFGDHFNRARLVVGSDLAYLIKSSKLNNNVSVRVSQIDPSTLTCVPFCTPHSRATHAFANDWSSSLTPDLCVLVLAFPLAGSTDFINSCEFECYFLRWKPPSFAISFDSCYNIINAFSLSSAPDTRSSTYKESRKHFTVSTLLSSYVER